MRWLLYTLASFAVIGLAYWAYKEDYATQEALRRVEELQHKIGAKREELAVLRAEWAYLNRPERLRELVELNYPSLGLMPLAADHFGRVEDVAFPAADPKDARAPRDVSATRGAAAVAARDNR